MWQSTETPEWLSDTSEEMEQAREALLGDYNMWVQLAGGRSAASAHAATTEFSANELSLGSVLTKLGSAGAAATTAPLPPRRGRGPASVCVRHLAVARI